MYNYNQIREVHLEVSSLCNARCPLCPRNFHGYPYNDGYTEHNMTLQEAKTIFDVDFVKQLKKLGVEGNFGDMVMNKHTAPILKYFREHNNDLYIEVVTNGSARKKDFWQQLAELNCTVIFSLDGLKDTHSIYRQDTNFDTIIENAQAFISAGGTAVWKMIVFAHNQHQVQDCEAMSKQLGFQHFQTIDSNRTDGVAVNRQGQVVNVIGNPDSTDFDKLFANKRTDEILLEDLTCTHKKISCKVKHSRSVYVSSIGEVYPCCFMGFQPRTYGHGQYYQVVNKQIKDIIKPNCALDQPLKQCIEWFNTVEQSWSIDDFKQGRLLICNDTCGS